MKILSPFFIGYKEVRLFYFVYQIKTLATHNKNHPTFTSYPSPSIF